MTFGTNCSKISQTVEQLLEIKKYCSIPDAPGLSMLPEIFCGLRMPPLVSVSLSNLRVLKINNEGLV